MEWGALLTFGQDSDVLRLALEKGSSCRERLDRKGQLRRRCSRPRQGHVSLNTGSLKERKVGVPGLGRGGICAQVGGTRSRWWRPHFKDGAGDGDVRRKSDLTSDRKLGTRCECGIHQKWKLRVISFKRFHRKENELLMKPCFCQGLWICFLHKVGYIFTSASASVSWPHHMEAEPEGDYFRFPPTFLLVCESTENEAFPLTFYNSNTQPSNLMLVLPI